MSTTITPLNHYIQLQLQFQEDLCIDNSSGIYINLPFTLPFNLGKSINLRLVVICLYHIVNVVLF